MADEPLIKNEDHEMPTEGGDDEVRHPTFDRTSSIRRDTLQKDQADICCSGGDCRDEAPRC